MLSMTKLTTGMVGAIPIGLPSLNKVFTYLLTYDLNTGMVYDLNNIQLRLGLYKVSMTNLIQHFYGIYDKIYDWNGIYDLNNIQLRQGL